MKAEIHPKYEEIEIVCNCGSTFATRSTVNKKNVRIEVCKECHPFFTGKRKVMDTEGKVQQFMRRYNMASKNDSEEDSK